MQRPSKAWNTQDMRFEQGFQVAWSLWLKVTFLDGTGRNLNTTKRHTGEATFPIDYFLV